MAGKHRNWFSKNDGNNASIPRHGGPVAGDGRSQARRGIVKGVVFRLANGKPALSPKPPKQGKK